MCLHVTLALLKMSQKQKQKQPQPTKPVTYGDVFDIAGELASQPITLEDAATLQSAEAIVLGQNPKGSPASLMQSAANVNQKRDIVGHNQMTSAVKNQGATVSEAEVDGYRVVTETIAGQVIGQYDLPKEVQTSHTENPDAITIGEALESTALSAGNKPIDQRDAAAIQAAESMATGLGHIVPGGIGVEAQFAAAYNLQTVREEDKKQLADILADATQKLANDKVASKEDVEGVIAAETGYTQEWDTHSGGVVASLAAAARINQQE